MKFWEAMKALSEGKKICRNGWEDNGYIQWNEACKCILDENGDCVDSDDFDISAEWEIYEGWEIEDVVRDAVVVNITCPICSANVYILRYETMFRYCPYCGGRVIKMKQEDE